MALIALFILKLSAVHIRVTVATGTLGIIFKFSPIRVTPEARLLLVLPFKRKPRSRMIKMGFVPCNR